VESLSKIVVNPRDQHIFGTDTLIIDLKMYVL